MYKVIPNHAHKNIAALATNKSRSAISVDCGRVLGRCQDSIGSSEGLGTGTNALQDLATADALRRNQVVGEVSQVATEALDAALGYEAEDAHLAVQTIIQVPARAR